VEFNDWKDEIVDMVSSCLYTPDVGQNKGYPYHEFVKFLECYNRWIKLPLRSREKPFN